MKKWKYMWKCPTCELKFDFKSSSQKASHSRQCLKIVKHGEIKDFNVNCKRCEKVLTVKEHEKLHPVKDKYYCSRSCANSRKEYWDANAKSYRKIAFRSWDMKCAICEFDKIVAVHHVDGNHSNDDPKNLIPLCPNHHEMTHSKWKEEIQPIINILVENKWGLSSVGRASDLHSEGSSVRSRMSPPKCVVVGDTPKL